MSSYAEGAVRRFGIILTILSIAGIAFFTLRPGGTTLTRSWSWYLTSGDAALAELIQNVILFMPFGIGLALTFPLSRRLVGLGAALSFCVEFAQQYIPGRDPSVGDIVANTIGTALGVLLVESAWLWLWAPPRRATWQALATAGIAVTVWFVTGRMVRYETPPFPYQVVVTPDFNHFGRYHGTVLNVRPGIGAIEATAIAAPAPPGRTSPLFAIVDRQENKVIMLSVLGTDLTLRYSMPAVRWTLEQPDLRLRDALKDVAPGDTFTAATWHDSTGVCLRLNSTQRCQLGYTIGDGWKLIYYPEGRGPGILGLLNTLWMAGTVVGVGFWAAMGKGGGVNGGGVKGGGVKSGGVKSGGVNGGVTSGGVTSGGVNGGGEGRRIRGAALALVIAGLLMVPLITGLKPTPLNEWIGAIGGLVVGWALAARCWVLGARG